MLKRRAGRWSIAAAAAVGVFLAIELWPDTIGTHSRNGVAWAEVVKALERATSIHIINTAVVNGKDARAEMWIRRPDQFRLDLPDQSIIDDGKTRLTIDHKARTAQPSDSPIPYGSTDMDWAIMAVNAFRDGLGPNYSLTRVDAECTKATMVYAIESKDSQRAKVWVQAQSLLLERLESTDPATGRPLRWTFDYEPISDAVFALPIAAGFKELPRLERGTLNGRVVDPGRAPVAGATVCVTDGGNFSTTTQTDNRGEFAIKLPPKGAPHERLEFPVFLRAFRLDDPESVAWTLLRNPDDHDLLGGTVPGDPGKVELDRGTGEPLCAGTKGIVLKMEPATSIAGRVVDPAGKPIAGGTATAEIVLMNQGGSGGTRTRLGGPNTQGQTTAVADDRGRYRLTHLPILWEPCSLHLRCSALGYATKEQHLTAGGSWPKDEVSFRLVRAYWTVSGRLVDDHGTALKHRSIVAQLNGERVPGCYAVTDDSGRFRLANCPSIAGVQITAELSFEPPLTGTGLRSGEPWYYLDVTKNIEPIPGRTSYDIELIARCPDVTLQVQVRNSAGEPVPYFPVELRGKGIPLGWIVSRFRVRTDAEGRCVLNNVPRADDLHVRCFAQTQIPNERIGDDVRRIAEGYKQRYGAIIDVPVNLSPDKTTYAIDATLLTQEENKRETR